MTQEPLTLILFLIMLTSIADTCSQLFLKSAINSLRPEVKGIKKALLFALRLIRLPRVWVAFLFSNISLVIWLFVLTRRDLNFVFSIGSMHYIFIAFAARLLLKEKIGLKRWFGTLLIVAGIMLVTLT